jgi:hypothetical protein
MATHFCLQCGAPLIVGIIEGREREHCPLCGFILYRNPAPVARAVVDHGGKLLLVRRTISPLKNYWAPPAGHVELGESLTQAGDDAGAVALFDHFPDPPPPDPSTATAADHWFYETLQHIKETLSSCD